MEKKQFFSNREIWAQVFGDDGRGGAIGDLHAKLNETAGQMTELSQSMQEIAGELKEINDINNRLKSIDVKVDKQRKKCEETLREYEVGEARDGGIKQAEADMADKIDARWRKNLQIIGLLVAATSVLVGLLGKFLW